MQKLTADNRKIFIYRIRNPDPAKYVFNVALKAFFIFADVRMMVEDVIPDGEVPIYDMTNYTLKHTTKVNLPVLKKFMIYSQVGRFKCMVSLSNTIIVVCRKRIQSN